jgi:hypothetical protein
LDEAIAEVDALRAEKEALEQADGSVDAADQPEWDRCDGELQAAEANKIELEGQVEGIQNELADRKQRQLDQERERAETAAREA